MKSAMFLVKIAPPFMSLSNASSLPVLVVPGVSPFGKVVLVKIGYICLVYFIWCIIYGVVYLVSESCCDGLKSSQCVEFICVGSFEF